MWGHLGPCHRGLAYLNRNFQRGCEQNHEALSLAHRAQAEVAGHPRVLRVARGMVHDSWAENQEFPGPAGWGFLVLGV